ncbi:hypothetical protein SAMN05216303_11413 [Rhodoferax sp. OV413]|nr:hypothetical protein SAMN05216303_11413 [Rhodoferax sp. OV413]
MGIKLSELWNLADTVPFSTEMGSRRWSLSTRRSGRATLCWISNRLLPLSLFQRSDLHWGRCAIAVCWLLHLYGDAHQPLRPASDFRDIHPTSDEGGDTLLSSHQISGVLTQQFLER